MNAVSFGWTAPAVEAEIKIVTRRDWKDSYASRFKKGDMLWALDKDYRYGGNRIKIIRLTCDPVKELMSDMPLLDYINEGFAYLHEHPELVPASMPIDVSEQGFIDWRNSGGSKWVIRFEYIVCAVCGAQRSTGCVCAEADELARKRINRSTRKVKA